MPLDLGSPPPATWGAPGAPSPGGRCLFLPRAQCCPGVPLFLCLHLPSLASTQGAGIK